MSRRDTSQSALDAALLLGGGADLGVALHQIAVAAQSALGATRATCYASTPGTGSIAALFTTEVDPLRRATIESTIGRARDSLPMNRLLDLSGEGTLVVEDLAADPRVPPALGPLLGAGSVMGVHLSHASVTDAGVRLPLGSLFCSFAEPRTFGDHERATLRALGNLASLALANAHLQQAAEASLARLATVEAEQAALLRVATRVAMAEHSAQAAYDVAAEEVRGLLQATMAVVVRYQAGTAQVVSGSGRREGLGGQVPLIEGGVLWAALRDQAPSTVDDYALMDEGAPARDHALGLGYRSAAAAPIRAEGRVWGALVAAFAHPNGADPETLGRLQHFADLVGLAVGNSASRVRLVERSTQDALTGLANHRTFFDRLDQEVARAVRGGRQLGLVVIDLDHFKRINDRHGHLAGDAVLVESARRIEAVARSDDLLGRIGGEEFAWLMPGTGLMAALHAAERARAALGGRSFAGVGRVTMSAGVAALDDTGPASPRMLFAAADAALYRAKAGGRDRCVTSLADPSEPEDHGG